MMYQMVGEIGEDPAWVSDLYQRMDNRITRPGLLTGESEYASRKCYLGAALFRGEAIGGDRSRWQLHMHVISRGTGSDR